MRLTQNISTIKTFATNVSLFKFKYKVNLSSSINRMFMLQIIGNWNRRKASSHFNNENTFSTKQLGQLKPKCHKKSHELKLLTCIFLDYISYIKGREQVL